MRWVHQYVANRNAFKDRFKLFLPITGSRKLSDKEFQPATDQPHRKPVGRCPDNHPPVGNPPPPEQSHPFSYGHQVSY